MIGLKIRSHLNEANKNPFTCLVRSRLTLIDCCLDLKYRSKLRECCFEISLWDARHHLFFHETCITRLIAFYSDDENWSFRLDFFHLNQLDNLILPSASLWSYGWDHHLVPRWIFSFLANAKIHVMFELDQNRLSSCLDQESIFHWTLLLRQSIGSCHDPSDRYFENCLAIPQPRCCSCGNESVDPSFC